MVVLQPPDTRQLLLDLQQGAQQQSRAPCGGLESCQAPGQMSFSCLDALGRFPYSGAS